MYIYVCMYIYMFIYVYVFVFTYIYTYIYIHVFLCIYVYIYLYVYIYILFYYIYTFVGTYISHIDYPFLAVIYISYFLVYTAQENYTPGLYTCPLPPEVCGGKAAFIFFGIWKRPVAGFSTLFQISPRSCSFNKNAFLCLRERV